MKKYLHKTLQSVSLCLMLAALISGCETQEIVVPEIEFFIAKEWKIDKFSINGKVMEASEMDPGDLISPYRLKLKDDFTFTQTYIDGTIGKGNWALKAGFSQLILSFTNSGDEISYLINTLEVRQLDVTLMQGIKDNQTGTWDYRYILVPIRGQ